MYKTGVTTLLPMHLFTLYPLMSSIRRSPQRALGWIGLLWISTLPVGAQWVTQTIKLGPGFNPVYLQVTPGDPSCASVFGDIPAIREVWLYNRYTQVATFVTNATQSTLGQDHWLTWFQAGGTKSFLSTLGQVRGGQSYLIKLATNAAPLTLTVKGLPQPPRSDWIPNDVVLAGFPISEIDRVTFHQFLLDSPQVASSAGQDSAVFSVNPQTAFESQIRNPETTKIQPGRAYWAYLQGHTHNPYPFEAVGPGDNNSVQFLQDNPISAIRLNNTITTSSQTLHLQLLESEAPPAGQPRKAGILPTAALIPAADGSYRVQNLANGVDIVLAPGESRQIRLGMILRALTPTRDTNSTYQALLEVTEKTHGYRQLVPLAGEVAGSRFFARNRSLLAFAGNKSPKPAGQDSTTAVSTSALSAGLWVGTLTLNGVNLPGFSSASNPDSSQSQVAPASPLSTRVMIHVDSNGVSRLVQQVIFASVSDGTNVATRMYSQLTNLPAGASFKSRVSAPSWPAAAPTPMLGSFGTNLSATVTVPFNDKVNPFVHRYHPDHNNLAEDFKTPLVAGQESFDINRQVSFYFGATIQSGTSSYAPTVPALRFTGTNTEYVQTSAFSTTPGLTVQCWLNIPTYNQQGAPLILLTNGGTHTQFKLAFQANTGRLALTIDGGSGSVSTLLTTNALPTGVWFNVTAAYDGTQSAAIYINGTEAASGYTPALASGAWDAAWVGNGATRGSPSLIGEIHDVVVRSGALSPQIVPQVLLVPQLLNASSIALELQGSAVTGGLINAGNATVTVNSSGNQLIDLASAPSVPPWTYGTAQGTYQETVFGLRRQSIILQGSFQLTRVSPDFNLY